MIRLIPRTPDLIAMAETRVYLEQCEREINAAIAKATNDLIANGYAAVNEKTMALLETIKADERIDVVNQ